MIADIESLLKSRVSLPKVWGGLAQSEKYLLCMEALPLYSRIETSQTPDFVEKLRECADKADADSLLAMIRGSFSEFLYDEFPQLESHYCDLLFIIFSLLGDDRVSRLDIRPGVAEILISTQSIPLHLVFNLRGSAEEAAAKTRFPAEENEKRVGVSFSAFDRSIDRWVSLPIS